MLETLSKEKPIAPNAIQFTGGEPTLREDLVEIVALAKSRGFEHIQLNTNGIKLSQDPTLAMRLRKAGAQVLYMSCDGMKPETNPKNYWELIPAMENCRKAGLGIVLVPTIIGGVNDQELGDMISFAMANNDVIKGINFQPVSLVGRMPDALRKQQRITIPDAIQRIESQTNGAIQSDHWFSIPCAKPVSDFIESLVKKPQYRFSVHFACGMATYVFKDGKKIVPITEFLDVPAFLKVTEQLSQEMRNGNGGHINKAVVLAKLLANIQTFINFDKMPKHLKLDKLLARSLMGGNYHALSQFHKNALFLGMMHFQDCYNYDLDRVKQCGIHYATPDGSIIPFCTFNVLPELYRDKIQRKYSIPATEWERQTGKKLAEDRYQRSQTAEQKTAIQKQYQKSLAM